MTSLSLFWTYTTLYSQIPQIKFNFLHITEYLYPFIIHMLNTLLIAKLIYKLLFSRINLK